MKEIINKYISLMGMAGLNPTKKSKLAFLYAFALNFVLFISIILQTMLLVVKHYDNYINLIVDIIMTCGVAQVLMKTYTLYTKRDVITKLIDMNFNKFWTFESLAQENLNDIKKIFAITKFIVKIYFVTISTTLFGLFVISYLIGNGNKVMNIWTPDSLKETVATWPVHEIVFAVQSYVMAVTTIFALVPCDSFFIIFVVTIIGQLRIMKIKLHSLSKDANPEDNTNLLVEIVRKHNLCFEYLADLETIYSNFMLLLLACNMIITTMVIFAIVSDSTMAQKVDYALIGAIVYFQIFIFCFMGQMIQDETENVASAAYNCKWEIIPDKHIRYMLIIIILRAQKYVNITMGGLFIMNLETFTGVSRATLSFLTLLLNMK